jgi:hypothetical protein
MKQCFAGLAFALALLAIGCTESARLSSLDVPDETYQQATPVDVAAYAAKYPTYDGVMLDVEETIEHSGIKDDAKSGLGLFGKLVKNWVYSRVRKEKYIILNPEAQWLSTYELSYIPDKLYMITISPSGVVTHFAKTDLQTVKDDKGRERYKIAFPRVEKGTVVEVGWESSYNVNKFLPPLEHDIKLQYAIPCEHLKFTFAYPNWWTIATKRLGQTKQVPVVRESDSSTRKMSMIYEATDVPAFGPEPYCPLFKQVATYLHFQVTSFEMMGMKWESDQSWDTVIKGFRTYAINKASKQSESVRRIADSLTAGAVTAREKVSRIVSWVSSTIEPSAKSNNADPYETLSERTGTIYDITGLAQAMLMEEDILAEYLLVHGAEDGWFDAAYVSAEQMWTPALNIQADSLQCVVFPWVKKLPISIVPDNYSGERAIKVDEDVTGTTMVVPRGDTRGNTIHQQMEVTVDTAGQLNVVQTQTVGGVSAYNIRCDLEKMDPIERRKLIDSMLSIKGADLTVDSFAIENDTMYTEPLVFRFYYTIRNLVTTTPEEIVVQTADLFRPALEGNRIDSLDRRNPVWIWHDEEATNTIVVRYPDTWTLTSSLQNDQIENQFGVTTCSYEQGPGSLTVRRSTLLKPCRTPKEGIADLMRLLGGGSETTAHALVFSVSGAGGKL